MRTKINISFILALLFCIPAFGQVAPETPQSHGITVVNKEWKFVKRIVFVKSSTASSGEEEMRAAQRARSKDYTPPPAAVEEIGKRAIQSVYHYKATFKNDGKKSVDEISWEYVFLDQATKKELGRRQFTTKKNIRPGSRKTFDEKSSLPPTNVISAGSAGSNFDEQYLGEIQIISVKYSDGSVWEAVN